jgi:VanZ family protein
MMWMVLRRGFALAMLTGIFILSNQPSLDILPPLFPMQDKVLHAGEFFLLGISLLLNRDLWHRGHTLLFVFAFGALWGGLDEFHQSFIPGRDCCLADFGADIVGLALAMTLSKPLLRLRAGYSPGVLDNEGV